MTTAIDEIANDILDLPTNDRAALAHRLIESLDGQADDDVEAAWLAEIDRRSADIRNGGVECRPVGEVITDIRRKLHDARPHSS